VSVVPSGILHIPQKVNDWAHIAPQRAGSGNRRMPLSIQVGLINT
jgi:hypothetical protein